MDNEQLLQALSVMIDEKLDKKLDEKLDPINSRLDTMGSRLDTMDLRLEKMESEIAASKTGQIELGKELRKVKDAVSNTYDLALEAWGQSTENRK